MRVTDPVCTAFLATLLLIGSSSIAAAEPRIIVNSNSAKTATPEFRFSDIPAPSATDAGTIAKLKIISGNRDHNGGQLNVLNDGKLPTHSDAPSENFFFSPDSKFGTILIDLQEAREIQSLTTYSWHVGERAHQKYSVYGIQEPEGIETATPERLRSEKTGEAKLLATVETSALLKSDEPPTQIGVHITGPEGKSLGTWRFLSFQTEKTDPSNMFSQTFFSEIDIEDGNIHTPPAASLPERFSFGDYTAVLNYTESPELKPWIDQTLKPAIETWYPQIVELLPSDGFRAPQEFTITFHAEMDGVAHAIGSDIHCSSKWMRANIEGEATGAVIHELVHVVQQYQTFRPGVRNPSWLVEGIADQIRWFRYEPVERRRGRPDFTRSKYTDSYHITAGFLNFVQNKYDENLIVRLNNQLRTKGYRPEIWSDWTGKTVDELWAEYAADSP